MRVKHGETVTVLRAGTKVDPFSGEEIAEDWATPNRTDVEGCVVVPRTTSEPLEAGRAPVIVGYTVHMPWGTEITARDRVELYGEVWQVDGYPFPWKNAFTGTEHGVEVQLKKVTG
jgi:hypothetical protein